MFLSNFILSGLKKINNVNEIILSIIYINLLSLLLTHYLLILSVLSGKDCSDCYNNSRRKP